MEPECPDCPHQRIVHSLSGGCTAKDCNCNRDNRGVNSVKALTINYKITNPTYVRNLVGSFLPEGSAIAECARWCITHGLIGEKFGVVLVED